VGSFFSALFGGSSANLNQNIGKTGQVADFATSLGEGNATAGSDFMRAITSGDASKISQTLAPEISAAKTSNQQSQKTNAEMGTRSGGTAAKNAASSDKLHSDITNLTGSLTGKAADTLLSSGSTFLGQGEAANMDNAKLGQQRYENWMSSILGKSITTGVSAAETYGLSVAGIKPPNNQDNQDNQDNS
jgi:hypothetical protein